MRRRPAGTFSLHFLFLALLFLFPFRLLFILFALLFLVLLLSCLPFRVLSLLISLHSGPVCPLQCPTTPRLTSRRLGLCSHPGLFRPVPPVFSLSLV